MLWDPPPVPSPTLVREQLIRERGQPPRNPSLSRYIRPFSRYPLRRDDKDRSDGTISRCLRRLMLPRTLDAFDYRRERLLTREQVAASRGDYVYDGCSVERRRMAWIGWRRVEESRCTWDDVGWRMSGCRGVSVSSEQRVAAALVQRMVCFWRNNGWLTG